MQGGAAERSSVSCLAELRRGTISGRQGLGLLRKDGHCLSLAVYVLQMSTFVGSESLTTVLVSSFHLGVFYSIVWSMQAFNSHLAPGLSIDSGSVPGDHLVSMALWLPNLKN